jgi:hypothetical protein
MDSEVPAVLTLRDLDSGPVVLLLNQPPYTKDDLAEFSEILEDPVSQHELIRILTTTKENLRALVSACASEPDVGQKLLTGILQVNCMVLKQLVRHKQFYELNPQIRRTCLECVFDTVGKPVKRLSARKKLSYSLSCSVPKTTTTKAESEKSAWVTSGEIDAKLITAIDQKTSERSSRRSIRKFNIERDSLIMPAWDEEKNDLPPFPNPMSEDPVPPLSKSRVAGSHNWFIKGQGSLGGLGALSLPDMTLESNSESEESEEKFTKSATSLELLQEENDWLDELRSNENISPRLSSIAATQGINLKSAMSLSRASAAGSVDSAITNVTENASNAWMREVNKTGVLVALGDLASLDPSIENIDLAERTISRVLRAAPNNVLVELPSMYGIYSRAGRSLQMRKRTRPVHLNKMTRELMKKFFGHLPGRTLVLADRNCELAEKLKSYYHCHTKVTSVRLITGIQNPVIDQLRQYPGFSEIYHRLCYQSNVMFEETELKEFDPDDSPKRLTVNSKRTVSCVENDTVFFGVDPTKLHTDHRFTEFEFENVIWNYQAEMDLDDNAKNRAQGELVTEFLRSVDCVLAKTKGTSVYMVLRQKSDTHPATGDEVTKSQYDAWDLASVVEEAGFVFRKLGTGLPINANNPSEKIFCYKLRKAGAEFEWSEPSEESSSQESYSDFDEEDELVIL